MKEDDCTHQVPGLGKGGVGEGGGGQGGVGVDVRVPVALGVV